MTANHICRAKTKSGDWVEGYVYWMPSGTFYIKQVIEYSATWDEPGGGASVKDYEIDADTLGRFSGIEDRIGHSMFEGDIIRCFHGGQKDTWIAEVVWDEDDARFALKWNGHVHERNFLYKGRPDFYEVLGNIHDNIELLNGK